MRVKEILKLPPPGAVIENGRLQVNVDLPGLLVRYTTDGTKPTSASHRYRGPVSVDEGATVKLRTFDTLGRGGRPVILEVSSYRGVFVYASSSKRPAHLPRRKSRCGLRTHR